MAIYGILVSARTLKQGSMMHVSKHSEEYLNSINFIGLNEEEMQAEQLEEGDPVTVKSDYGEVDLTCKKMKVPKGVIFMPLSYLANRLLSTETHGTGVPDFKNTKVVVTRNTKPGAARAAKVEAAQDQEA
jgi:formylmethanofuran dehydrogenase subunit D